MRGYDGTGPSDQGTMTSRVAISALGTGLDDRVDERFGRAAYLLVIEPASLALEVIDNSANRNALQGAGLGAAEAVSARGAGVVVTGHLGPKAFRALEAAGIKGYDGSGMTVREAVDAWAEGALAALGQGEAHAGLE